MSCTEVARDRSPLRRNSDIDIIENNTMAVLRVEKMHIDSIPEFNGDKGTLAVFIQASEYLLITYTDRVNINNPQNEFLLRAIIGKLRGRALEIISSRCELNTWNGIKALLLRFFSDPRDEKCLLGDLLHVKQHKNENAIIFGNRCQDLLSLLLTKLQLIETDENARRAKIQIYESQALDAYLRGLNNSLAIRLQKPENLEKAISLNIEEDNFSYAKNSLSQHSNYNLNSNKPSFSANQQFNGRSNDQRYFKPPTFEQHVQHSFNGNRPRFNNNNFNINRNSGNFRYQNFNTHRSNNFRNNNSYKPFQSGHTNYQNRQTTYNNRAGQYRPEPMDTSSGNTRNVSQNNFMSDEVFQQEIVENLEPHSIVNNYENNDENFRVIGPNNNMM